MGTHRSPVTPGPDTAADIEHHIDREGLVIQLRALATAVARLADAVEHRTRDELPPEVSESLDEVRWQLKRIW